MSCPQRLKAEKGLAKDLLAGQGIVRNPRLRLMLA
jgi:hypothetical protein